MTRSKSTSTTIAVMEDLGQVVILSMAAPLLVGDAPAWATSP